MADKEGSERVFFPELRSACIEILSDLFCCQIRQVNCADFSSFSADAEFAGVEVDGRLVECGQFRDT